MYMFQVRYVLLMFLSYPLALTLRHVLHPRHTPLYFRYVFSLTMGMAMGLLCFGWQQMATLVSIILVCYALLYLSPVYTQR